MRDFFCLVYEPLKVASLSALISRRTPHSQQLLTPACFMLLFRSMTSPNCILEHCLNCLSGWVNLATSLLTLKYPFGLVCLIVHLSLTEFIRNSQISLNPSHWSIPPNAMLQLQAVGQTCKLQFIRRALRKAGSVAKVAIYNLQRH